MKVRRPAWRIYIIEIVEGILRDIHNVNHVYSFMEEMKMAII